MAAATAAKDAVYLGQLPGLGATVDSSGNVTNLFVAYDDTTKGIGHVRRQGGFDDAGDALANVAAGKAGTDAVNVNQLEALGWASSTRSPATQRTRLPTSHMTTQARQQSRWAARTGTQIHNVAAGTTAKDAVNLAQLEALGTTWLIRWAT